ncbi:MAG: hypothetical protein JKY30_14390, partial [Flavobacteriales bacterium]|nr:hypothetical protein [Flavobacteriales bacterium]
MNKFLSILLLLLITNSIWSQHPKIDSLQNELTLIKEDSSKVTLLLKIGDAYGREKPDSNLFYKKRALNLSEQHRLSITPQIVTETIKALTGTNQYEEVIEFGLKYYEPYKAENLIYE